LLLSLASIYIKDLEIIYHRDAHYGLGTKKKKEKRKTPLAIPLTATVFSPLI